MGAKCCSPTLKMNTGVKIPVFDNPGDSTNEVSDEPHSVREVLILEAHCSKKGRTPKGLFTQENLYKEEKLCPQINGMKEAYQSGDLKIEPVASTDRQSRSPVLWTADNESSVVCEKLISRSLKTKHLSEQSSVQLDISCFRGKRKDEVDSKYDILESIGRGSCGEVLKAKHKITKEVRALKILNSSTVEVSEKILEEINILKRLDHPNLLTLYEFYQSETKYFIITEFCKGGNLIQQLARVERVREMQVTGIMSQIFSALIYCHKKHIIHRDLKPENIAFKGNWIGSVLKIIDFGLSTVLRPRAKLTERVGSLYYVSPEVLQMKEYNEKRKQRYYQIHVNILFNREKYRCLEGATSWKEDKITLLYNNTTKNAIFGAVE